jgi:hypothetical protein
VLLRLLAQFKASIVRMAAYSMLYVFASVCCCLACRAEKKAEKAAAKKAEKEKAAWESGGKKVRVAKVWNSIFCAFL